MDLNVRVWDTLENKFLPQVGGLTLVELSSSIYKVDMAPGTIMRSGMTIWENDIVMFNHARGFRKYWNSVSDIPEIEEHFQKGLNDKTTKYGHIIYWNGEFVLHQHDLGNIKVECLSRGQIRRESENMSGEFVEVWDDFAIIGNVWEMPEYLISLNWRRRKERDKWEAHKILKDNPNLTFVCGGCHEDAGKPHHIMDGELVCQHCGYELTRRTGGGQNDPFNWFPKFKYNAYKK